MAIKRSVPDAPQLDLLGSEQARSTEIHRLFFALIPDEAVRSQLVGAAQSLRLASNIRARWVNPARYHATLHFLGDHPSLRMDLVNAAKAAADKVRSPSFEWRLDQASGFRGRQPPCVVGGSMTPAPMQQLWQDLRHALTLAGQGRHMERSFTPHITLAYSHGTVLGTTAIEPIVWSVAGFELVHSIVGQAGDSQRTYETLGAWHLADERQKS
ncbi:RNA 2',3'-cyclic phosphodiesterase [Dyella tabacisoli]|uniref:RNA 2',3'-cyclic phosphodiesterase n=1 Tax=Dyella tabacisoli TaxID=2282381 RepID=A0A369UMM6_9GAMM|nr:RNA 2',3'-cyclic phosphodiesterase [Dyella tabacisoli]RDD81781.1 RNA 2',3'-cyclic phosphodiesterase [Dyella tabacisoli]